MSKPIRIIKSGMTSTGSDTRMYGPRSESSHMFQANHEEEAGYGGEDGEYRDARIDRKKKERRERANEMKRLKHISITTADLPAVEDEDEDLQPTKFDNELEPSLMTGTHGNYGAMTSMANQARGPGFAGGHAFAMGEPMEIAFQLLKAYKDEHLQSYLDGDINEMSMFGNSFDENRYPLLHMNVNHPMVQEHDDAVNELTGSNEGVEAFEPQLREYENNLKLLHDYMVTSRSPRGAPRQLSIPANNLLQTMRNQTNYHHMNHEDLTLINMTMYMASLKALKHKNSQPSFDQSMMGDLKGNPIEIAFQLLKNERQGFVGKKPKRGKGAKERKAHKERQKKWRPSTGEFKRPPGGMTPGSATSRRAKARMRGIAGGKKTGLSRAHLAVEMSHRGVKTKQPMSKDVKRYRQYLGQSEARKRLGNIRTVSSTPSRFGARSYKAGLTGGGTLQSLLPGQAQQMRRPALRSIRPPPLMPPSSPRRATLPSPSIPSPPVMSQPRMGVGVQSMSGQSPTYRPRLPSSTIQGAPVMTGEVGEGSELQKRGLSYYDVAELRQLVNDARRAMKRKESKKKGKGEKNVGSASNLPAHNNAPTKETTRPEGATEDATNDPRTFGINPLDHLTSRGGRTP